MINLIQHFAQQQAATDLPPSALQQSAGVGGEGAATLGVAWGSLWGGRPPPPLLAAADGGFPPLRLPKHSTELESDSGADQPGTVSKRWKFYGAAGKNFSPSGIWHRVSDGAGS